jgi:hypothetical protein
VGSGTQMRDPVGTHARAVAASFYLLDFPALLMVTRPQIVLVFVFGRNTNCK